MRLKPFKEFELENRVDYRITCDELGYPLCEASYAHPAEWEQVNGRSWLDQCADDYEFLMGGKEEDA